MDWLADDKTDSPIDNALNRSRRERNLRHQRYRRSEFPRGRGF